MKLILNSNQRKIIRLLRKFDKVTAVNIFGQFVSQNLNEERRIK